MRVLHSSDLHGKYGALLKMMEEDFSVWIDTGDFFPNRTRGDVAIEPRYQAGWFEKEGLGKKLVSMLRGRPLITVGGNHDYASLAELIRLSGGTALDLCERPAFVGGLKFAGFREIPWIRGEWRGETMDFGSIVEKALSADPDVLVTHGPPAGILDKCPMHGTGTVALTTALTYKPHKIKTHLFGHIHDWGGQELMEMDTRFINGATKVRTLTL
tara:strand:- start:1064 stop:1705 length:642 start_codon:yes stop_codon:yes gene_type:complete